MLSTPTRALPVAAARLSAVLSDRFLRVPLVFFIVAQLLDILTTTVGLVHGLDEANPLTAGVIHHLGMAGLLLQKVPVVLALVCGLMLLPRRVAVASAWGFTVLMGAVVASNLSLVLAARPL
ncbi:MAG TPA: DUF5658 family protein [Candidatus Dormibacteraeota bacterium]|jgi:hypothetical protein